MKFVDVKSKSVIFGYFGLLIVMVCIAAYNIGSLVKVIRLGNINELRAFMSYQKVEDGDEATQAEGVSFDSYVLKDLDGDGNAEKVRGTCKQIGAQDTLYMELNVNSGTLKNAQIQVQGKNFFLSTAIPEDNIVSSNYISSNTSQIALKEVSGGTNSLLTGSIKSGDYSYSSTKALAIKYGNINNYSCNDNKVILTGTYVDDNGNEKSISKEVNLTVDWYGKINTQIDTTYQTYKLNDANNTLEFNINVNDTKNELMLSKVYVEGVIPDLNGYMPTNVILPEGATYDENTRKFVIQKENQVDENGNISNKISINNNFEIKVEYPMEAFISQNNVFSYVMQIPVSCYYEGYNNAKVTDNITKSNVESKEILVIYSSQLDKKADFEYGSQINTNFLSKKNALLAYDNKENVVDDYYENTWNVVRLRRVSGNPIIIDQYEADCMDQFSASSIENYKISFTGKIVELLGEDGYIRLYNAKTNELIKEFDKSNWNEEYTYPNSVETIRIETSNTVPASKELGYLSVHNVKKVNNLKLSQELPIDSLLSVNNIFSYSKCTCGNDVDSIAYTKYKNYTSDIKTEISSTDFSSQVASKFNLRIDTSNVTFKDASFLIKFPSEVTSVKLDKVYYSDTNLYLNTDIYKKDNNIFLSIKTKGELKGNYILPELDVEFDKLSTTKSLNIETFAQNPYYEIYDLSKRSKDIYDMSSTSDYVAYSNNSFNLIAPNNLVTTEYLLNSDGSIIGNTSQELEIDKDKILENKTVRVGILDNYSSGSLDDIYIVGNIPFKGNSYQLVDKEIGSQYDSYMTDQGIIVPEELKDKVKVYYSENQKVNKNLNDLSNNWTQTPTDFSKVKSYLIDLSSVKLNLGEKYNFDYNIKLQTNIEYNEVSYSTHAVHFKLNTNEGSLNQKIESSRLGIRIAKRYNLQINKYEELSQDIVEGSTYSISDGETTKYATTDSNGKIYFDGLYVQKQYNIKEEQANSNYEIDDLIKTFNTYIENNELKINMINSSVRDTNVYKDENGYNATISLDSKLKYWLNLNKFIKGDNSVLPNVKFSLTGQGKDTQLVTDSNGNVKVYGLLQDKEYTLKELYCEGLNVLPEDIVFKVVKENNEFKFHIVSGTIRADSNIEKVTSNQRKFNLNVENNVQSKYTLELEKIDNQTEDSVPNTVFNISGKWINDGVSSYTTNSNGIIRKELYEGQEYTLVETKPADGYVLNNQQIKFVANKDDEGKWKLNVIEGSFKAEPQIENNKIKVQLGNERIFTITKEDGDTKQLLKGVKFAIYQVNKTEENTEVLSQAKDINDNIVGVSQEINGVQYQILETDENGRISQRLKAGLYKVIEVQALTGYKEDIERNTFYFGIDQADAGKSNLSLEWENENIAQKAISQTYDSGYVGVLNDKITKYDSNFNIQWQKSGNATPGWSWQSEYKGYFKVEQTYDGGYVALSYANITKLDSLGNIEWEKPYDDWVNGFYSDVVITKDGNILIGKILCGNYSNREEPETWALGHIAVFKFDLKGNKIWKKDMLRSSDKDDGCSGAGLIEDNEGNYLVYTGTTTSDCREGGSNIYKLDCNGNLIWSTILSHTTGYEYGYDKVTSAYSGILADDGGYVLAGATNSFVEYGVYGTSTNPNYGSNVALIVKLSKDGQIEWMKENVNAKIYLGVDRLKNGNYIFQSDDSLFLYSKDFELLGEYKFQSPMLSSRGLYYNYRINPYCTLGWNRFRVLNNDDILVAGTNSDSNKTSLLKVNSQSQSFAQKQEIRVYNSLKEYNIITTCQENGTISGKGQVVYEKVKYSKDSKNSIIITPNDGYAVGKVMVNGKEVQFKENQDSTVTLPAFTDVKEDKMINATFILKSSIGYVDVEHYENNTNKEIAQSSKIRGNVGETYTTSPDSNIVGYSLVEEKLPQNSSGIISSQEEEVVYYYEKQPVKIITHYIDKDTNESISADKEDYKNIDESYSTYPLSIVDDKYVLDSYTNNKDGIIKGTEEGNEINVYYYYKKKEFTIKAQCINEGGTFQESNKVLSQQVKYGENSSYDITIYPDSTHEIDYISINGNNIEFKLNSDGTVTLGKFVNVQESKNINVGFKEIDSKVIVSYVDKLTNNKIKEDTEILGKVGQEYIAYAPSAINDYVILDRNVDNAIGKFSKSYTNVVFYYNQVEAGVIVKYLEEGTDTKLAEDIVISGKVGLEYITVSKEIDGYKLVNEPDNKEGIMKEGISEVIYYYTKVNNEIAPKVDTTEVDIPRDTTEVTNTPNTGDILAIIIVVIVMCTIIFIVTFTFKKRGEKNDKK